MARLSGGAAEFLEMWEIMMFGKQPFSVRDGKLELSFEPCFPEYLTGKGKTITATFLGSVPVTYKLPEQRAVLPGTYTVEQITVETEQGEESFSRTVTGRRQRWCGRDVFAPSRFRWQGSSEDK